MSDKGWFVVPGEDNEYEIVEVKGSEEEILKRTQRYIHNEDGVPVGDNPEFITPQVFWNKESLDSYIQSIYFPTVYSQNPNAALEAKLDKLIELLGGKV